ncbi:uncharacterized protein MONOS_3363 [Monocercomonoides exilis]|uniref:uncharacterized protein n=1 Tax=Monocercomonoides exilis TaxID=2049356 RepID=UPI00355967B4|nr:hypothetical protein MONOS_3363 [Monocercomonoides exilis]|eukprot:MONOS_3363.1-p1 / transcript=MONOS_3363.1 / gene=MONOS_3363 / organism=Monocercomonoides_exilis_PA203 / gene_product=unspecified product / transcript_product=unspecified product / location=Mono_scaffold00078:118521-118922(-) / protein_length=88 / sequence_SO=supercontig / SO=protein_coding / is_pseudo=false
MEGLIVTHWFADRLSFSKEVRAKSSSLLVLRPDWIIDCCDEKKLLPVDEYLIYKPKIQKTSILSFFSKQGQNEKSKDETNLFKKDDS